MTTLRQRSSSVAGVWRGTGIFIDPMEINLEIGPETNLEVNLEINPKIKKVGE